MSDHIKIRETQSTWVVRTGGAVIAESTRALELAEGDYAPVIYFPRDDVAMALLERTDHSTHCPHKGDASYFTVVAPDESLLNAAWSYEAPKPGMEPIKDHIAFYGNKVAVEKL